MAAKVIQEGIWMKKALVLFLTLALCLSVVSVFAAPKPSIGCIIYKFDDTFMSYLRNQIQTDAKGKIDISVQDGQNDQPKENDEVDQFISQGVTVLAINMVDPSAVSVMIGKAQKKNLPLVLFNREPDAADMAKYANAYYVGAKALDSGTYEGQIIAKYWKATPAADLNKDGVMQYVMLIGDPANTDAKFRTQFSVAAVEAAGIKTQALASDTAMWDRPKAQEKMAAWLTAYAGKIEVVFANNDDMALGAIEALKAAGYFKGGKYMPVVGVDATPPALDALAQGTLLGTVKNDATGQGHAVFDLAFDLGSGKKAAASYPYAETKSTLVLADQNGKVNPNGHYIWVPYTMVTKDNYKDYMAK
jgi:methyl-galactoside transport system substrate-binding protein